MSLEAILATESHLPEVNRGAGEFVGMGLYENPEAFEKYCSLTITRNGQPICGILYHNYQPDTGVVEMSIHSTSPRWMTRETVSKAMAVAYDQIGCQMAVARVSERNERAAQMLRGIGFTGYLIPRLRGRDEDEWVFTLTDDDWRASRLYRP